MNGSRGEGLGKALAPYSMDLRRRRMRVSARASEAMHGVAERLTTPCRRRGLDRPGQHWCGAAEEFWIPAALRARVGGHRGGFSR